MSRPRLRSPIALATRLLALSTLLAATAGAIEPPNPSVSPRLAKHQEAFAEARVIQVSERVFVAFAYSMCNVVMVVGDEGVAIFDTGFRLEEGQAALRALRAKSNLPIRAVVYSHGHTDHTGGSRAFVPADADPPIRVYAQANYARYLAEMHASTRLIFRRRAVGQLGMILPEGKTGTVGSGGGPVVRFAGTVGYAAPTDIVQERATIDLGGIRLELFHAPGDLDDALAAWIPEEGVLLTGDTVVGTRTHPILSTPRYEKGRDARAYIETLSRMRDYPARVLVGGHGVPIEGHAAVADLLERTEMVAQFMIDETLRLTKQNLSGPEIAAAVKIPESLVGGQEFADYYHRLSWIVRGVYAKEMGWYGGDVLELVAHSPVHRARRLVAALGGAGSVLDQGEAAYRSDDPRWAAELATLVLTLRPEDKRAIDLKANSLRAIAYQSDSANERNYLLTEANVMSGELGWNVLAQGALNRVKALFVGPTVPESALSAPSYTFIQNMGPRLSVARAADADELIELRVTDRAEVYRLRIREGVMLEEHGTAVEPDAIVELDHETLVLASEGLSSWSDLIDSDRVVVREGAPKFDTFVGRFDW